MPSCGRKGRNIKAYSIWQSGSSNQVLTRHSHSSIHTDKTVDQVVCAGGRLKTGGLGGKAECNVKAQTCWDSEIRGKEILRKISRNFRTNKTQSVNMHNWKKPENVLNQMGEGGVMCGQKWYL